MSGLSPTHVDIIDGEFPPLLYITSVGTGEGQFKYTTTEYIFLLEMKQGVYLPTQLERTLQLYW